MNAPFALTTRTSGPMTYRLQVANSQGDAVRTVTAGQGVPLVTDAAPGSWADFARPTTDTGNLDRARTLLDEAGQPELDAPLTVGSRERERRAVEAVELDLPCRKVEGRPGVPAGRAAVVTEVADVGGGVVVGRPAANAVLRVGGVLQRGPGLLGVVQPEGHRAGRARCEIAHDGVVRIHDNGRPAPEGGDGLAPPVGHELELAVAVELVAEEVAET